MYVYLIQPRDCSNRPDVYKIGMSSKQDLSRLRSYGTGTRYICMIEVENYLETERRLKAAFGSSFYLDHGNEYYSVNDEEAAVSIFLRIASEMRGVKYVQDEFSKKVNQYKLGEYKSKKYQPYSQINRGQASLSFVERISKFKFGAN